LNPFERLLDALNWTPIPKHEIGEPGTADMPHATHEATLEIMDHRLRVYRLSNGQRVIDAKDFEKFCESSM